MGKSLSLDILERVVSLVETGHSCHEASQRLCISADSAIRIMQRPLHNRRFTPLLGFGMFALGNLRRFYGPYLR